MITIVGEAAAASLPVPLRRSPSAGQGRPLSTRNAPLGKNKGGGVVE